MRDLRSQPFYDVIKEYDDWVVLFRGRQVTVGSVIIMIKDTSIHSLGGVSSEAWSEYGEVCRDVEDWLSSAFGAEKFNYVALMMKDPEVHFHVIPRYSAPVKFNGKMYVDTDWPEKTNLKAVDMTDKDKKAIFEKLLEAAG